MSDTTIRLPALRWRVPENKPACAHPPEQVAADILEGDVPGTAVQWCKHCGAVRRIYTESDRS